MPSRLAILTASLLVTMAQPLLAQEPFSIPARTSLHFESWRVAALHHSIPVPGKSLEPGDRKNRWLVAGAVGAAAGVVFCTAMSTLINDSASGGLSFCPLDTYLLFGGAGFLLGAAVGLAF